MPGLDDTGFRLSPGVVQVRYARLISDVTGVLSKGLSDCPVPYLSLLSDDERSRAGGYVFERDRIRYIAARGLLRLLLGRYLNTDGATIQFGYNAFGKPALAGSFAGKLHFNLSHAGDWAVYAFALDREVGIDIEPFHYDGPWRDMAASVFSRNELAEFEAIPQPEKPWAFQRGWVRKEAYVKGRGEGLSYPLDAFAVPLAQLKERMPAMVMNHDDSAIRWSVCPLDLISGYASALAVEGTPAGITVFQWFDSTEACEPANNAPHRLRAPDQAGIMPHAIGPSPGKKNIGSIFRRKQG
ncbi:4'-phosphopantetheinyl transferase family protein [Methylosarcina fibrata]|uniref:4'-phosphopantetheinyl transferase family protein n=1 Tax=Methylosarcina fibrata TaxID=105972 RepID=UPI0003804044|nr:4'-phosphopantetheinyl transferase superfamily protein [Methylosarcina fibrata]